MLPRSVQNQRGRIFIIQKLVDLRPKDNIPSFENYMRKQVPELIHLLKLAMRRQIAQLEEAIEKAPYKSKS